MSWECVSYWIEHHPGLASWVQAVGSICAILAAIGIANRDSRFRRKAEREFRLGAVTRGITAVADARTRVMAGFEGVKAMGASRNLVDSIKADFEKSEQHLKEAMAIQGVDAQIYVHLYEARTAVEEAAQVLYLVPSETFASEQIMSRLSDAFTSLCALRNRNE